jgi:hypothetical protein
MDRYPRSIACRRGCLGVTEQTADNGQSKPATGAEACVGVPQIMKPNSL